jgi:hypothetical protein
MDIRLGLSQYPPLSFVFQVVEFMVGHKTLHTAREVFSHVHLLFVGQGKPEAGMQFVSGSIDHFWHGEIR